ncbi:MAG: SDR family oxidoreductase [Candidatus Dadabacteria bacterium]|nr:SDR family oxidoreductase [Candidatus Dadabacteria bacterium]
MEKKLISRLDEKNYVVVGGTSGIGAKVVELLAGKYKVTVLSRNVNQNQGNNNVYSLNCDVTQKPSIETQLPEAISGLVYCPGTINLKPFSQLKDSDFLEDFNINLLGAVRIIRACLSRLKNTETSSVVLFSTVAVQTGMPYHSSVASAKGAVEGLTRSLAAELAPGIRVNCIAPSLTDTPLANRLISSEQKKKIVETRHPLKRYGKPEDIANLVDYLLSDKSSWITGQIIAVDGGISSLNLLK